MHLDLQIRRLPSGKTNIRALLRQYVKDEQGNYKKKTVMSLSHLPLDIIIAFNLALKFKDNLKGIDSLFNSSDDFQSKQGPSVGATMLLLQKAKDLGVVKALGNTENGKLLLWQVIARTLEQGSRLSAVRLANDRDAFGLLKLKKSFDEDNLYGNLDYAEKNQTRIENKLYKFRNEKRKQEQKKLPSQQFYLYDVTSSYLEGDCNELGFFGYNRDKKKGKKQIVVGLLCDDEGCPLSIEVFDGNTSDTKTMASQIKKVASRFGDGEVVFVGDKGMIKSAQMKALEEANMHYVTSITKAQIKKLVNDEVIDMGLFDNDLVEIEHEGVRYVLRCNPVRADETESVRKNNEKRIADKIAKSNKYLQEHPRAKVQTQVKYIEDLLAKTTLKKWLSVSTSSRSIKLEVDATARAQAVVLDGCYVLKTSLPASRASAAEVHTRYKDLSLVEQAFSCMKTVNLEIRPLFLRKASRTRGHALVVMLSYILIRELRYCWSEFDLTVEEGLRSLRELCAIDRVVKGSVIRREIPLPRDLNSALLSAAGVELPSLLALSDLPKAVTKRKLPERRLSRVT